MVLIPGHELMDEAAMSRALIRISHEIVEHNDGLENVAIIGIQKRGVPLAMRLRKLLEEIEGIKVPMGILDITFYRDDLSMLSAHPVVNGTDIPFDVNGKKIILVDDVLYTGRTTRAAIENIFDMGRPANIQLAILIDMGTDIIIMRHNQSGAPHFIAPYLKASVVNAGDGMNEHPTQALLDMLTMYERFDTFEGKNIAICGDIYHSRVVRSNAIGLKKLGANVSVYGPKTMMPVGIENMGVRIADSVADCIKDADAVMGLRVQLERQQKSLFPSIAEYAKFYAITPEMLALAKPDAFLMHPGPCNHGVELPTAVYDCDQSVINEQVTNGVAVRMAVLYLLMARRNNL